MRVFSLSSFNCGISRGCLSGNFLRSSFDGPSSLFQHRSYYLLGLFDSVDIPVIDKQTLNERL